MERRRQPPTKVPAKKWIRIKVLSMGDAGTGKSCLIKRYCEDKFVSKYISTIGVDYGVKGIVLAGEEVKVNFWDLAGSKEYLEVRNEFYKDTQGCLLVFDVSSKKSFDNLEAWLKESKQYGASDPTIIVCANFCDSKSRVVTEKEGRQWAQARGFPYFETSASSGQNVKEAFDSLFQRVLEKIDAQRK